MMIWINNLESLWKAEQIPEHIVSAEVHTEEAQGSLWFSYACCSIKNLLSLTLVLHFKKNLK